MSLFATPQHPRGAPPASPAPAHAEHAHPTPAQATPDELEERVSSLRAMVRRCLEDNLNETAAFMADKLVTMSGKAEGDVMLLGRAYLACGEYRRAVLVLRQRGMLDPASASAGPAAFVLAAQCLVACKEWEECLAVLGGDADDCVEAFLATGDEDGGRQHQHQTTIDPRATLALLRARVYEALENRARAVQWYREALVRDARCAEAFDRLVGGRMMGADEERRFAESLAFAPADAWMRDVYLFKLRSHSRGGGDDMRRRMEEVGGAHGLRGNVELQVCLARSQFLRRDYRGCYATTKGVIVDDPYHVEVLPIHLCALVELELKSELFYTAHQLVEAYPGKAVSWLAVGMYYLLGGKFDLARTYFHKATVVDNHFAPAWVAFGHGFAYQDESDQALAAYRTAARLFEGSSVPLVCIGIEYLRTQNLVLADQFLRRASALSPDDPLVFNETGVLAFREGRHAEAARLFERALALAGEHNAAAWEPTLFNLGHAYRRLGRHEDAVRAYTRARRLRPRDYTIDVAIGLTHQLVGDLDRAVQHYHRALGIRPTDTMATDLLGTALGEMYS